ncbi:MAG: CheR family methyltransferase [Verrucomicrobiota bacterium]|nr:CheR family methyltransferase [Verrucomicrobiota bacterium]
MAKRNLPKSDQFIFSNGLAEAKAANSSASQIPDSPELWIAILFGQGGELQAIEFCARLTKRGRFWIALIPIGAELNSRTLAGISQTLRKSGSQPAKNGLSLLSPQIVLLNPRKTNLVSKEKTLLVSQAQKTAGTASSVDRFLLSLAETFENRAAAVLLSGKKLFALNGLRAIKAEGGLVFAQDQRRSQNQNLTVSRTAGVIDFILAPERIIRNLIDAARHAALACVDGNSEDTVSQQDLDRIFAILRLLSGVDFTYYKQSTLRRRILRRMVLTKKETFKDYHQYLQVKPGEVDLLFHDLLINVTHFFRDPHVFQTLKKKVFPKIVRFNQRDEPTRIWIPACSTGEEAYSIAIAFLEFLGKDSHNTSLQIFATDISETALNKARAGVYPESIAAELTPQRLRRFFHKVEAGYQITKSIRDLCVFARQNVVEDPPFSRIDLISCRNLLIYLGPVLQKKVIPIFNYSLKPNGYLLLGASETIAGFTEFFGLVEKQAKLYIRKQSLLRPDIEFKAGLTLVNASPSIDINAGADEMFDLQVQVDRILLSQYAPSGVIHKLTL